MLMTSLSDKQTLFRDIDSALMEAEAYFLTICTHSRQLSLGQIDKGQLKLNARGKLVEEEWLQTVATNQNLELDAYVVMPNHFHAIFWLSAVKTISENSEQFPHSSGDTRRESISAEDVIQSYKATVTDRAQRLLGMPGTPFWQPSFHAHRIRQNKALPSLRKYIQDNPADWMQDNLNPAVGDPSCEITPAYISE